MSLELFETGFKNLLFCLGTPIKKTNCDMSIANTSFHLPYKMPGAAPLSDCFDAWNLIPTPKDGTGSSHPEKILFKKASIFFVALST